jgi:hypothetical protein
MFHISVAKFCGFVMQSTFFIKLIIFQNEQKKGLLCVCTWFVMIETRWLSYEEVAHMCLDLPSGGVFRRVAHPCFKFPVQVSI